MPQIPITIRRDQDRPLVKVVYDPFLQPAAGQNAVFVVPQGYRLQLKSLFATIVTDANVANRTLFLRIAGPNGIYYYFEHPFLITAGETRTVTVAPSLSLIAHTLTTLSAIWPFPIDYPIEEGVIITLGLVNIQVGDQISQINPMLLSQFVAE
jgi:hypothetical protein